jgi:hypothetical protein
MTNPAHQIHKVSGVSHYTTVSVLQDSHPLSATMQTGIPPQGGMNAFVAPERRAFTGDLSAVQNGLYEIQRGITSLSQVYLCFRPV